MSDQHFVQFEGHRYAVTVNDPNVIERVLQNQDPEGVPQPRRRGGKGWQDTFYDLKTRGEVLRHLVYNWVKNSRRANWLDGWADVANDAVLIKEVTLA